MFFRAYFVLRFSNLLAVSLGVPGVRDSLSIMALLPNFCSKLLIIDGCHNHPFVLTHNPARLSWIFAENLFCIFVANSCICSFFPIMSMSSTYMMIMNIPSSFSFNSIHGSAGLTVKPKGSFFAMSTKFFKNCLAAWH